MAVINILNRHVSELIAAGEVVERPASVVKELCENAIDAGATKIVVLIECGGIKRIEIQDDGCGIEPEYMKNAFISHATSKISNERDLDKISTLGFRGEALASIAAVAKVRMLSKTAENENAYEYEIFGGEEISFEQAARPQGTTIVVRDIFFNTPARMKFLKKDVSEGTFVSDVVSKLALSNPNVSFKFIRDGKEQFFAPGDGETLSAISSVLSRDFARDLLEVNYTENDVTVTGYITPPRGARASRAMQNFFINGRFVKSRIVMAALENAYRGILMGGRFPGCVLYINVPFDKVDVNIHPAKTEVRFARESDVFDAVYRGAKSILFKPESMEKEFGFSKKTISEKHWFTNDNSAVKQITFTHNETAEKPTEVKTFADKITQVASKIIGYNNLKNYNIDTLASDNNSVYETKKTVEVSAETINTAKTLEKEDVNKTVNLEKKFAQEVNNEVCIKEKPETEELLYVGEIFKTYILAQRGDEFCFIDKHAAHERILYEKLQQNYGNVSCQQLLEPVTVALSAQEKTSIMENLEYLLDFGFEVDDFGTNSVLVRAVPCDIVVSDIQGLVVELAEKLATNTKKPLSDKTQWVLSSIACRAAVKAGETTKPEELLYIAKQIIDGDIPAFCPHGRPVLLRLTKKELEKQFGRLG